MFSRQKHARKQAMQRLRSEVAPDTVAVAVLADLINHPDSTLKACSRRLGRKGIDIHLEAIERLLDYHGVEKTPAMGSSSALKQHLDQLMIRVSPAFLFPRMPKIFFEPSIRSCPFCGAALKVKKTPTKTVVTLHIGAFQAHETILGCPECDSEACYGFNGNLRSLSLVNYHAKRAWYKWLCRRSQRARLNWERFEDLLKDYPLTQRRIYVRIWGT